MTLLKVTTFNANNQTRARAFLERRFSPDIALLQEVKAAHWPAALIPAARREGKPHESATGIDASGCIVTPLSDELGKSAPRGHIVAAQVVTPPGESVTAVSIYAPCGPQGRPDPDTAHAIVDDLEPLLKSRAAERLILGGDFNLWDQLGRSAAERRWQVSYQQLLERLDGHGLVNLLHATRASRPTLDWCDCGRGDDCWHVPTVRRMRTGQPLNCDYLFASRWLAERLHSLEVIDIMDPELRVASDHAPVVATFDLGRSR